MDVYVGLLTKSKERFEQNCTNLESVPTKRRRQCPGEFDSSTPSVFRRVRTRCQLLTEFYDILAVFKDKLVHLRLLPCFAEVYYRMFHLNKRVRKENMGLFTAKRDRRNDGYKEH